MREALKSDDIEQVKKATGELEGQLAALYNAAQQAQAAAGAAPGAGTGQPAGDETPPPEEPRQAKGKVVEAEVVD